MLGGSSKVAESQFGGDFTAILQISISSEHFREYFRNLNKKKNQTKIAWSQEPRIATTSQYLYNNSAV